MGRMLLPLFRAIACAWSLKVRESCPLTGKGGVEMRWVEFSLWNPQGKGEGEG